MNAEFFRDTFNDLVAFQFRLDAKLTHIFGLDPVKIHLAASSRQPVGVVHSLQRRPACISIGDFFHKPRRSHVSSCEYSAVSLDRCLPRVMSFLALLLVPLIFCACKKEERTQSGEAPSADIAISADDKVVRGLIADEETCLALSPKMNALSEALMQLRLPGPGAKPIFAPSVSVSDLAPPPAVRATGAAMLESQPWPASTVIQKVGTVDLWSTLLQATASFDHTRVYLIDGEHPQGDPYRFEANAGFEALARMKSGEWRSFEGRMKLSWERPQHPDGKAGEWQITRWTTERMNFISSPNRLFVESLDRAMRSPEEAAKLRRSLHYEASVQHYRDGMKALPHPYFAPISANQKEGLAVADIDGDGFDDIYITVRMGANLLLHNNRDGTFTEDAARRGLALPGHTTCALFADFDNDGDLDAMLGRSLLRTTYLENRGGKFFDTPFPNSCRWLSSRWQRQTTTRMGFWMFISAPIGPPRPWGRVQPEA